jgi:hypothetical protein
VQSNDYSTKKYLEQKIKEKGHEMKTFYRTDADFIGANPGFYPTLGEARAALVSAAGRPLKFRKRSEGEWFLYDYANGEWVAMITEVPIEEDEED